MFNLLYWIKELLIDGLPWIIIGVLVIILLAVLI